MVLTAPVIDGVDDEGDASRVWHGCRFGLVVKSTPIKQQSQLPQDNLRATIVGLEGLSTSGVYESHLKSSQGHPLLDGGCRYLSALCCTGFDKNLNSVTWLK